MGKIILVVLFIVFVAPLLMILPGFTISSVGFIIMAVNIPRLVKYDPKLDEGYHESLFYALVGLASFMFGIFAPLESFIN